MKKGLSKILSLACVFALLMTMAIPAFAAEGDTTKEIKFTNVPAGAEIAEDENGVAFTVQTKNDKNEITDYVFLKMSNGKVKLYKYTESEDGTEGKIAGSPVKGELKTVADGTYLFDKQNGYLQVGDKNGVVIWRKDSGDNVQYLVGLDAKDNVKAENQPKAYCVAESKTDVVGNTYYINGVAEEGKKGPVFQKKNSNGIIEIVVGPVSFEAEKDAYGNVITEAHVEVYGYDSTALEDITDKKGNTLKAVKQVTGGTDGTEAEVILSAKYDSDKGYWVADKKAKYIIDENDFALTDDGSGNPLVKGAEGIYILNEDGSIIKNEDAEPKGDQKLENVWKYDGNLTDFGKDVEVEIGGYKQWFYIPAGQNTIAQDYFRYVPTSDGQNYEGISYYNQNGITYAGWVDAGSGARKYQTIITRPGEDDVYILVVGKQYIPAGVDPTDTTKAIEAGWYLFDEDGALVKTTGSVTLNGKRYVIDSKNMIVSVDGKAPSFEN